MHKIVTDVILVDVVGFSLLSTEDQFLTAVTISDVAREAADILDLPLVRQTPQWVLGMVATGDGFYVILVEPLAGYGPLLALALRNLLLFHNQRSGKLFRGVRTTVHQGVILPFTDAAGNTNYIGPGMNECARLQALSSHFAKVAERFAGDVNWVLASTAVWRHFQSRYNCSRLVTKGFRISPEIRFPDKHGQEHAGVFMELKRNWLPGM